MPETTDRGAAVLVGALLMFGIVILLVSVLQVGIVPAETQAAEIEHSDRVTDALTDLRAATLTAARRDDGSSVTVPLGARYPDRAILLNPPPAGGRLSTTRSSLLVSNAFAPGTAWDGTTRAFETRLVTYTPDYNAYAELSSSGFEHGVAYRRFDDSTVADSAQPIVDGRTISLLALTGRLDRTGTHATAVSVRPVSAPARTVQVSGRDGPVTLQFPTRMSESAWRTLLEDQFRTESNADGYVESLAYQQRPDAPDQVTIRLVRNATYRVRMAAVGLGRSVAEPKPTQVVPVGTGEAAVGERFGVRVLDAYGNPVPGGTVSVGTTLGACEVPATATADENGVVSLSCESPDVVTASVGNGTRSYESASTVVRATDAVTDEPVVSATLSRSESAFRTSRRRRVRSQYRLRYGLSDDVGLDRLRIELRTPEGETVTAETLDANGRVAEGRWTSPWVGRGDLTATVTGVDEHGRFASVSLAPGETVVTPIADAGPDRTAAAGDAVSFTGTSSVGDVVSYEWDFGDGATATGADVSHTYQAPGTYSVALTVTDSQGNTDTDTALVTVTEPLLTANAGPDRAVTMGDAVSFDGGGSLGDVVSYEWQFGDGTTATGQQVSHTYASAGTYTVTLTVTDSAGRTSTDTATVTVSETPLSAVITGPTSGTTGQPVGFDGSASSGNIAAYSWNWGDGTTSTGATPSHTYASPGTYTVGLTVTSEAGRTASTTHTITVTNPPLTADPGPDRTVQAGQSLTLDGGGSTGDIVSYSWNFGDGTSATGQVVSKTWSTPGMYPVTLTVTDRFGQTATNEMTVTVTQAPVPLSAAAGQDRTIQPGQYITFDGRGSTGDIVRYEWEFGDGTTATGSVVQRTYLNPGTYTVRLTVTDSAGRTATDTATVNVIQVEPTNPLEYVSGSAVADGQVSGDRSGVRLQLRNTGTREVTITNVWVRDAAPASGSKPSRVQIGKQLTGIWNDEIFLAANVQSGRYKGTVTIGPATANNYLLSRPARLGGGTTATLYFYQFRPPGTGLNMQGGRVSLTITYTVGGETRTLALDNVLIS